ncbi:MAG TPA: polysaccharide deacetylase family protein [Planctomycetota bacterium]|nr:polysaccharide deacetylase family protein [Planctomycetota bacterium]
MTATATISVDVDPVDIHLAGYGLVGGERDGSVYASALPRLRSSFAELRIRATFFVVARDAAEHAPELAALVAEGHEVASHSLTHPAPFLRLPEEQREAEIRESKSQLESACGLPVVGFRAPNWDIGPAAVEPLVQAGYLYDASAFPSPFLTAARATLLLRGKRQAVSRLRTIPSTFTRAPHVWRARGAEIREFPISVTPIVRFPVYHTMRYALRESHFLRLLDGFARRGESFFYPLHAIDALGLAEDGLDERLRKHPGMSRPLEEKLELLRRTFHEIEQRFRIVTYRDRLAPPRRRVAVG